MDTVPRGMVLAAALCFMAVNFTYVSRAAAAGAFAEEENVPAGTPEAAVDGVAADGLRAAEEDPPAGTPEAAVDGVAADGLRAAEENAPAGTPEAAGDEAAEDEEAVDGPWAEGVRVVREETERPEEAAITVTSGVFKEQGNSRPPAETYLWEGEEYRLRSWQLITATMPEIRRYVRKSVIYKEVEQAMKIPEQADFYVTDEETGRQTTATLPLTDSTYSEWRWSDGFVFPVTVLDYDTGRFLLGGTEIPVKEEQPFEGYEEELLGLIGADPAYYRIDHVEWTEEPGTGEDGRIYRRALASGRKKTADVRAVYEGEVVIPSEEGMAYQALYVRAVPRETRKVPETAEEPAVQAVPPPAEEAAARPPETGFWAWIRNLQTVTKVIMGLGFLLFPFLFILRKRRKRRKKQRE